MLVLRVGALKALFGKYEREKVDIIRWFEDPVEQLVEALKPAVPQNVNLDRDKRRMYFEVKEDVLVVAIEQENKCSINFAFTRMETRYWQSGRQGSWL